ncbi:hypothetical protein PB2503_06887 [Parvularcula bermudensis HTCC2503]|uniref:NAD(P)-binding domain-containing protein n=1 Tax=Parvularcula bermudensis (strain ATCC BAA-594 / HTCC2503 / KCTC 12087) TaxID=314260 RepID=E0TE68_PARBH|nr:SDR family oxidoreductase [Parvularcula bermudensis]ADM09443.1 hypothetical protein PB2503_06887 [Parvularcula bermudensis HTCC2503]
MRVLIAGATGLTGRRLTQQLLDAQHTPIAMVRKGSDWEDLPQGVIIREGDLTAIDASLLDGIDAVVFAAGSGGDTSTEMTEKVDRDGAIALIDLAVRQGVERFVMLSSIGTDNPGEAPAPMRPYLEAKRAADDHLKQSGLQYTIVRPVSLTKEEGSRAVILGQDVDPDASAARGDVAAILLRALSDDTLCNQTFDMQSAA